MNKYLLALLLVPFVANAEDFREPVVLPACDTSNPVVTVIDTTGGFSQLNDPSKRVFCIKPGNYGATKLNLTASGTATEPRYIRYFDPEETTETHPANMEESKRAIVETLFFLGSHHWVVDRITVRAITQYANVRMQPRLPYNSHWADDVNNIVLNRLLVENSFGGAGQVAMGGYNLTVQDSVIRNSQITPMQDDHAIVFYGSNNKVIWNEMYNHAGDNVQVSRAGNIVGGIIAYNDMYMRHEWRTYGDGKLHQYGFGTHQCQENAIGFKGGGTQETPILVKGNKIWGFNREVDPNCATGGGGIFPISLSFNVQYIDFEDNIIFDSVLGVVFANPTSTNVNFRRNLFYDLDYAISAPPNKTHDNSYVDNIWYDIEGRPFLDDLDVPNGANTISGNHVLDKQVCFTKYQITNPTEVCIGKGVITESSPVNTKNIGNKSHF